MTLEHLVFYDGQCGLCDQAVQFILKRDRQENFCFAPLQGETAEKLLKDRFKDVDSLILIENFRTDPVVYLEGEAILRICSRLPFPYYLIYVSIIFPQAVYNSAYRLVARHRKQLFSVSCMLPDPKQPNRFLK